LSIVGAQDFDLAGGSASDSAGGEEYWQSNEPTVDLERQA
jgi:hypothetical protein